MQHPISPTLPLLKSWAEAQSSDVWPKVFAVPQGWEEHPVIVARTFWELFSRDLLGWLPKYRRSFWNLWTGAPHVDLLDYLEIEIVPELGIIHVHARMRSDTGVAECEGIEAEIHFLWRQALTRDPTGKKLNPRVWVDALADQYPTGYHQLLRTLQRVELELKFYLKEEVGGQKPLKTVTLSRYADPHSHIGEGALYLPVTSGRSSCKRQQPFNEDILTVDWSGRPSTTGTIFILKDNEPDILLSCCRFWRLYIRDILSKLANALAQHCTKQKLADLGPIRIHADFRILEGAIRVAPYFHGSWRDFHHDVKCIEAALHPALRFGEGTGEPTTIDHDNEEEFEKQWQDCLFCWGRALLDSASIMRVCENCNLPELEVRCYSYGDDSPPFLRTTFTR